MDAIHITLPEKLHPQSVIDLQTALADLPPLPLFLVGTDEQFCGGLDLGALLEAPPEDMKMFGEVFSACLTTISQHPAPTVAVVAGPALGGGLGIATAADLILAGPAARFGLPELLYGFVPGFILPSLLRRMQPQKVRRLAIPGLPVDRETGSALGLVDEMFDEPQDRVIKRLTRQLARPEPKALGQLRALLSVPGDVDDPIWQESCRNTSISMLQDEGKKEALARYLAEGTPPWENRT